MEENKKPIVSRWVSNYVGTMVLNMFIFVVIIVALVAWHQVTRGGEYAAEFAGMINYLVVSFMTIFIGVMGALFGISQKDIKENVAQQKEVSKEIGAEKFVQMQIDKLDASVPEQE